MDNASATVSTVSAAIVAMAQSVADAGLGLVAAILPILAPIVAAIIIATLGYKLVRRFAA